MSLGTSDTLMIWLEQPQACLEGIILVNPVDSNSFIGMLWWVNNSGGGGDWGYS